MKYSMTARPLAILLICVFVTAGCSRSGSRGGEVEVFPPLENVHSLLPAFEWDDVHEDYILVRPGGLAVDRNKEILILDEDYLKVFDLDGNPLRLMGGPGSGPGEFERVRSLWYSPDAYYTVFGGTFGFTAHFFRPDHSYIERVNHMSSPLYQDLMQAQDLRPQRPEVVLNLNETDRIYSIDSQHIDREQRNFQKVFLFHDSPDSLRLIVEYRQTNMVWGERMGSSTPTLGHLLLIALPRGRIAYTHTWHDQSSGEERSIYTIHVLDPVTGDGYTIEHPFVPIEHDYKIRELDEEYRARNPEQARDMVEVSRMLKERHDEHMFLAPLSNLLISEDYLLAYHARNRGDYQEGEEYLFHVDIFEIENGQYVNSAMLPYGNFIHDGILYGLTFSPDEGSTVKRISIDPVIYRRR